MNFSTFNVTAIQCVRFLKKEREAAAVGWQPTNAENKNIPALTESSLLNMDNTEESVLRAAYYNFLKFGGKSLFLYKLLETDVGSWSIK